MAEYREIHGAEVDSVAGTSGTIEGEIFYDSSADAFKFTVFNRFPVYFDS